MRIAQHLEKRILVIEPMIEAVRRLHTFVSSQVHHHHSIGYAAEGEVCYDEKSTIVYVTAGHIMARLRKMKYENISSFFQSYDVIMVDEVHELNADVEFIVILIHQYVYDRIKIPVNARDTRFILCSATVQWTHTIDQFPTVPIFSLSSNTEFITETFYFYRDGEVDTERLVQNMFELAIYLHTILLDLSDDILLFLPGQKEVNEFTKLFESKKEPCLTGQVKAIVSQMELTHVFHNTREWISKKLISLESRNSHSFCLADIQLLSFSSRSSSHQKNALDTPKHSKRKIILATNVLEASVTLPNVLVVIDSMIERTVIASPIQGTSLVTRECSRGSSEQRKGRVGRVANGLCFRMTSEKAFHKQPKRCSDYALDHIPLHRLILWCIREEKSIGFFVEDGWKNPRVIETIDTLCKVGVLNDRSWANAVLETAGYTWTDSMVVYEVLSKHKDNLQLLLLVLYIVSMEGSRYDLFIIEEDKNCRKKHRKEHERFIDSLSCFTVYWRVFSAVFCESNVDSFLDENLLDKMKVWCSTNFIDRDRMVRAVKSFSFLIGCIPCDVGQLFHECMKEKDVEDVLPTISKMSKIYQKILPHREATLRAQPSKKSKHVRYFSSYKPLLRDFVVRFESDYSGVILSPDYVPSRILVLSGSDPTMEQQGRPYTFTAVYHLE